MVCIYCAHATSVTNSRLQKRSNTIWRRRRCLACKAIFTTSEQPLYSQALAVQYDTSHIVPFDRDTLFLSIYNSCRHRPTSVSDATALTTTATAHLIAAAPQGLLSRSDIVRLVSTMLSNFDTAAHVHYTAFHRP